MWKELSINLILSNLSYNLIRTVILQSCLIVSYKNALRLVQNVLPTNSSVYALQNNSLVNSISSFIF